uniref:Uncharacterized protein n=1 Tax=Glossina pallidipes TaxID=7398 RepID=A0A1A9Z6W4_GLOPL
MAFRGEWDEFNNHWPLNNHLSYLDNLADVVGIIVVAVNGASAQENFSLAEYPETLHSFNHYSTFGSKDVGEHVRREKEENIKSPNINFMSGIRELVKVLSANIWHIAYPRLYVTFSVTSRSGDYFFTT